MQLGPDQDASNRRGCSIVVTIGFLVLILLVAIGLGWIGDVDRKVSDLIVIEGG